MSSSTDERIPIGYISRAHGIKGEVVVVSESDDDRFTSGAAFLTDQAEVLTVRRARVGPHGRIVAFEEVPDRNRAEELRGRTLTIGPDQRRELEEAEYWPQDLIGLTAVDETGSAVGVIADVALGTAQDRLRIELPDQRIVDVPFVDDLVPEVDLDAGVVVIRPVAGLISEEE